MKVLFISSGNSQFGLSPIIKNQGDSLKSIGVNIEYYLLNGKGFIGYLKSITPLRKHLKNNKYDIIHAHFSLTCFVAAIAGANPLVASLMGWNIKLLKYKIPIYLFNKFYFNACIVKSKKMADSLGLKELYIIPNGINLDRFYPMNKDTALSFLKWDSNSKHILFAADPKRPIKNLSLAKAAFDILCKKYTNLKFHWLENIPNENMVYLYNASDVVLLTSKAEGSPNVIKEAMACNAKIVSTDVGDVSELFENTTGNFIAKDNAEDIASKIQLALNFNKSVNSREKIYKYKSENIAKEIVDIYNSILNK